MRRCVFLDRDGVINVKAQRGEYIRGVREFHIIPRVIEWIRLFNALDFLVIVVTNQRGVAKGVMDRSDLERVHQHLRDELSRRGARIDDIFSCVHEEGACDCRKPRPGMVLAAAAKWDIDIPNSVVIGDSDTDRQLAEHCGMRFISVDEGRVLEVTN
jgi:D-glycero-D-manno-heptose 1,7-bisphosphate phosphatase